MTIFTLFTCTYLLTQVRSRLMQKQGSSVVMRKLIGLTLIFPVSRKNPWEREPQIKVETGFLASFERKSAMGACQGKQLSNQSRLGFR